MSRRLLIIGAGIEQIPGIKLAKRMGINVILTDGNPKALGFKYADDYEIISTYDVKKTVEFAKKYNKRKKIDGVMTLASDVPLTVSSVADALGLPGNSISTARLASNKLLMKKKFVECGVPAPVFKEVKNVSDVKDFLKLWGYPVVLKPVDSRGARGVLRITRGIDLDWAFKTSKSFSKTKRVIAEQFLHGNQISTESIVLDGKIYTPGLSDRNYEYLEKFSPHIIENGGDLPALLNNEQRRKIDEVLLKAANALGINNNSVKGDVVYTKYGPKIIEIAARLSGGWFCTDEIPLSTGVDLVKAVIKLSLGDKLHVRDLVPKYNKGVALRYVFSSGGIVSSISGINEVKKIRGVVKVGINIKKGSVIDSVSDHTKRLGYVISLSGTKKQAIGIAKKAVSLVRVKMTKGL